MAARRFDVRLGAGVEAALAERFAGPEYAGEVAHHNASLPIRLVEDALANMAERSMLALEASVAAGGAPEAIDPAELSTLRVEDFR